LVEWCLVGVGVAAALAGLARLGVGRVQAESRTAMAAGQADAPRISAPTLKAYSRETVVDVTVTDKDGKPVHGLTRADFTVKEDGKVQPIRGFEEFGKAGPAAAKELPKLPPNVYTNLQPPPTSSAVNILLLDFTNAAPIIDLSSGSIGAFSLSRAMVRQHHIKQYAMQYLQSMPAGTRVAVLGASYPGTLRVLQGITSDPALLSAAVSTMNYDTDASVDFDPHNMDRTIEAYCAQQNQRNRMTLESLDQIAADLVGVKGRKNLLWFTVGIPTITDPAYRPRCLPDYSAELKKAYGLLAATQVTVFPIGVRGVSVVGDPVGDSWPDEQLSMESVAEATGGTAYYNSNDLAPLIAKAIDTGSDYYTLSYVPPGSEYDGRHHTIKVETDQQGLHLTYRDSYYAEDPAKVLPKAQFSLNATPPASNNSDMRLAMSRSMPTSQQLLFDVQVEPSTEVVKATDPQGTILGTLDPVVKVKLKDKPLIRYDFNYAIPARQIAFSSGPDGTHNGSLELDIAVYDADAKLVTGLSQTVKMPLSDDKYRQFIQGPFRFSQQIDLPVGLLFVRIGILDRTSKKAGTLEIPLAVAKASGLVTAGR